MLDGQDGKGAVVKEGREEAFEIRKRRYLAAAFEGLKPFLPLPTQFRDFSTGAVEKPVEKRLLEVTSS